MKYFRLVWMALFAISMCVNITSCDEEKRAERREKREKLARQQFIEDSLRIVREKRQAERAIEREAEKKRLEAEKKRFEAEMAQRAKERIKTESITAWGDAKFGMSPKEVKATSAFKDSYKYVKGTIRENGRRSLSYIDLSYDARTKFNKNLSLRLGASDFYAGFSSEELTSIGFRCLEKDASYINDIVYDAQILSYHFTEKYGKPKFEKGSVSILDFDRGREFTYAEWEIGDKTAIIFMGESQYGSEFYYRVLIYNSNFPTKPDIEEQEAIKKYEEKKKQESANYF